MSADGFFIEGKRDVGALGVALEALPVAFEGEGDAFVDAHGGEKAPAAEQAALTGRKACLVDGDKAVIVKHDAVDHGVEGPSEGEVILAQNACQNGSERHRIKEEKSAAKMQGFNSWKMAPLY